MRTRQSGARGKGQWRKAMAAKSDGLSSTSGTKGKKRRSNYSSCLPTPKCVMAHAATHSHAQRSAFKKLKIKTKAKTKPPKNSR